MFIAALVLFFFSGQKTFRIRYAKFVGLVMVPILLVPSKKGIFTKQRKVLMFFLPAAKPTGHRTARVVVVVVGEGLL